MTHRACQSGNGPWQMEWAMAATAPNITDLVVRFLTGVSARLLRISAAVDFGSRSVPHRAAFSFSSH
jgi:hypothetical protein